MIAILLSAIGAGAFTTVIAGTFMSNPVGFLWFSLPLGLLNLVGQIYDSKKSKEFNNIASKEYHKTRLEKWLDNNPNKLPTMSEYIDLNK